MTARVHRIETPSTREIWAAEGNGQLAHRVLAAQLLTEQAALCGYEPRADWMAADGPHPVVPIGRCKVCLRRLKADSRNRVVERHGDVLRELAKR